MRDFSYFCSHGWHLCPYPFLQLEVRLLRVLFRAVFETERTVFESVERGDHWREELPNAWEIAGQARNDVLAL